MKIDLHTHSNHSDGTWSVEELIEYAVSIGLTHVALTDHDTISGIEPARIIARDRIELINGVEINTVSRDRYNQIQDVHILGYFINPNSGELSAALNDQQFHRQKHVDRVLERLNGAGVPLTLDDIKAFSGTGSIGKAHITKALVSIGAAKDIMEAYEKFTSKGSPFYIQRESITPLEAVHAIRAAGGVASLAHSGKRADLKELLKTLIQGGLEAVEVFHRMHSLDLQKELQNLAFENNLLITGGSDCHGPYEEHPPSIGTITCPVEAYEKLRLRTLSQFSNCS